MVNIFMREWSPAATLGNVMLIIVISYVIVDIIFNKRHNIVQLLGKLFVIILCMVIILFRRSG